MDNATQITETVDNATAEATPAVATKAPSKKSQALAIFQNKMADRAAGKFASNKEFRAAVLNTIIADLGVSVASAATMYNAAKQEAEAADTSVKLGRDPKKEKAPSTGKRGRPVGSKNKSKDAEVPAKSEVSPATESPAVEVAVEDVTVNEVILTAVADVDPVVAKQEAEAVPA